MQNQPFLDNVKSKAPLYSKEIPKLQKLVSMFLQQYSAVEYIFKAKEVS